MMAQAAEMDHSKMNHSAMSHATMVHDAPSALATLSVMPASGNSREGGADGRYVMESTSVLDSMAEQCAKASRGLIMLDNAALVTVRRQAAGCGIDITRYGHGS
jgi:uncharacterized protein involved in copper resistance